VREQWADAEAADQKLRRSDDPAWRFAGIFNLAEARLLKGKTAEALEILSTASTLAQSASTRNVAAVVLLATTSSRGVAGAQHAFTDARGMGSHPNKSQPDRPGPGALATEPPPARPSEIWRR
jgi:hypothetical protein